MPNFRLCVLNYPILPAKPQNYLELSAFHENKRTQLPLEKRTPLNCVLPTLVKKRNPGLRRGIWERGRGAMRATKLYNLLSEFCELTI